MLKDYLLTLAILLLTGLTAVSIVAVFCLFFYEYFSLIQISKQVGAQLVIFTVMFFLWRLLLGILNRAHPK